jgi:hypothetical protein
MTATDTMYQAIAAQSQLPTDVAWQLRDAGFVVIPGPATPGGIERLSEAYDHAVATADAADVRVASSTRVTDFVNRGPEFDGIYIFPPLLAACCLIIGRPAPNPPVPGFQEERIELRKQSGSTTTNSSASP